MNCSICDNKQLFKCGNCNLIYYCSKRCQISDWPIHKLFCKILLDDKLLKLKILELYQEFRLNDLFRIELLSLYKNQDIILELVFNIQDPVFKPVNIKHKPSNEFVIFADFLQKKTELQSDQTIITILVKINQINKYIFLIEHEY